MCIIGTFRKEAPSVEHKQRHKTAAVGAPSPFHCANPPAAARDTRPAQRRLYAVLLSALPNVAIWLIRGHSSGLCFCRCAMQNVACPRKSCLFCDFFCGEFNPHPRLSIILYVVSTHIWAPSCAPCEETTKPYPRGRFQVLGECQPARDIISTLGSARTKKGSTPVA